MISLFIDTSLADVSIALLKENKLLSQIHNNIPGEHSIYVTNCSKWTGIIYWYKNWCNYS